MNTKQPRWARCPTTAGLLVRPERPSPHQDRVEPLARGHRSTAVDKPLYSAAMTSKALSTLLAALSVGLLATACGDDGGGTGSASETESATDPTTDTPTTSSPSTSATTMNMSMTSN